LVLRQSKRTASVAKSLAMGERRGWGAVGAGENEKFDFSMEKWQDRPVPHQPGNLMPSEILP
jgi:hypothetical protein